MNLSHLHSHLTKQAHTVMEKKNHDYTGGQNHKDTLKNFRLVKTMGVCNLKQSVLVRLSDKVMRLSAFSDDSFEAKVIDESVEDTVVDLINYAVLWYAAQLEEKDQNVTDQSQGQECHQEHCSSESKE